MQTDWKIGNLCLIHCFKNITRIAKAASRNLPGKSNLIVSLSCHKQVRSYMTRCGQCRAHLSEWWITSYLVPEGLHSVLGGYASVPAGYDKILVVMIKFLEVVVLFQAVIQYTTTCGYKAALAAKNCCRSKRTQLIVVPFGFFLS